jgi:hypothetical protein
MCGNVGELDKLWDWVKEAINTDKLNNKLLLAKDDEKNIVLNHASLSGKVQIFFRIRNCTKEELKPAELNKFLLAQYNHRHKAWHVTAQGGNVDVLDKLLEGPKDVLNKEKLNNNLLLAKDDEGNTALQHA